MRNNSVTQYWKHNLPHANRGVGTLFVSVALVLLTTLAALYLNHSTVSELRTISNEVRAQQALQAADSGLNCAIHLYFKADPAVIKTAAGVASIKNSCINSVTAPTPPTPTIKLTDIQFCEYTVSTTPATIQTLKAGCVSPPTGSSVLVVATGSSDDGTATHYASMVLASRAGGLRLGNIAPLTVQGATGTLTGNATVINNGNNLTIWTGADISSLSGSFETKINIAGLDNQLSSEKTGANVSIGPDVVTNDYNLRNLSQENYERLALLQTFDEFKIRAELKIDLASMSAATAASKIAAGGFKSVVIFNSSGAAVSLDLSASIGSSSNPVAIAIDGNVKFSGKPTIYGSIYSSGTADFKGGGDVYGAVISKVVDGPPGKGNFTITADASVMAKVEDILDPSRAAVAGSWRDW